MPKGYRSFLSIQFCFFFCPVLLLRAVPGTSEGYRTSFIDCNTFILYSDPWFLLRDRNYPFRGWTSGPLFSTVQGLRTPGEEPLWPEFRDVRSYARNNNVTKIVRCVSSDRWSPKANSHGVPHCLRIRLPTLSSWLIIGNMQ